MASHARYGEPNWLVQPYTDDQGDHCLTPADDNSYEENRLQYESQFLVPLVKETDTACETLRHTGRIVVADSLSSLSTQQARFLSASVTVLVGPENAHFQVPSDFLTKRSEPFRVMLVSECQEASRRTIHLPETAKQTFEHVAVWAMSPHPELNSDLPVTVTVDIAVFATVYLWPALLHQALDLFREQIISDQAVLTLELLEHIYAHVDPHSLLRYLTQAALATLGRSWSPAKATDEVLDRWMQVIERSPTMGADYFFVQVKGWTALDLAKGGTCRFHRHSVSNGTWSSPSRRVFCIRSAGECFEDAEDDQNNERDCDHEGGGGSKKHKKTKTKKCSEKAKSEAGREVDISVSRQATLPTSGTRERNLSDGFSTLALTAPAAEDNLE